MNIIKTAIVRCINHRARVFEDARGYFFESFFQREFEEKVAPHLSLFIFQPDKTFNLK